METSSTQPSPVDENNPASAMMDDPLDETPTFLLPEDAVEVQVDDDDVPMEEDDDDDGVQVDPVAAAADSGDDRMMEEEQPEGITATSAVDNNDDMSQIQLKTHTGPVYAVAASAMTTSPNNNTELVVLSGGGDDKGFMHKISLPGTATTSTATTATASTSIPLSFAHTDSVACAAIATLPAAAATTDAAAATTPPRLAAVGGYDGAICVYRTDTGALHSTLTGPTDVEWLDFHPSGTVLLAGSAADGTVWMYHVPTQKCMQVFVGHESAVTAGAFARPAGKVALTASGDGTLRVWNPKTGQCKHVFRFSQNSNTAAAAAGLTCLGLRGGSDEKLVLVGAEDGLAHVCHIGTKKVVASLRHYEVPAGVGARDDGDEEELMELPRSVEAVGFFPGNPNWCATAGVDGVLKVWDLAFDGGQCRAVCRVGAPGAADNETNPTTSTTNSGGGGITRLVWHPTLPLIVASYTTGAVRWWDARNGQLVSTYWTTGSTTTATTQEVVINDLQVQWLDNNDNYNKAVMVTASDDAVVRVFFVDNVAALMAQAAATATTATATTAAATAAMM